MRLVLFALVSWSAVAAAQPAPAEPPSKTLERGLKLHDKKDHYSASIELHKVVSGQTADTPPNVQRAQLVLAAALHRMHYHAAALAMLSRIVEAGPAHAAHAQAMRWIVELAELPGSHAAEYLAYRGRLEEAAATLDEPARSALLYRLGAARAAASTAGDARRMLERVAPGSPHHPRALLELVRLAPRGELPAGAAAALAEAGAGDPAAAAEAARAIAGSRLAAVDPAGARDALQRLAAVSPSAAFTRSRVELELARTVPGLPEAPVAAFEAVIVATTCARGWTRDVRPEAAVTVRGTREAIDELLAAGGDDSVRMHELVERFLGEDPASRADRAPVLAIRIALAGTHATAAWAAQLERELQLYARSDRAWQSTPIGGEVLQELSVQDVVARTELGKRYRERLESMRRDLDAVAGVVGGAPAAIAAGPEAPVGRGLFVSDEACGAAAGQAQIAARPGGARRGLGCAGCASHGDPALVLVLALAWLVAARARRRPRR